MSSVKISKFQKMKVKYITPPGVKDKWTNVPAMRIVPKAGIWTRQRLVRNDQGYWQRIGRLIKKVYKD